MLMCAKVDILLGEIIVKYIIARGDHDIKMEHHICVVKTNLAKIKKKQFVFIK